MSKRADSMALQGLYGVFKGRKHAFFWHRIDPPGGQYARLDDVYKESLPLSILPTRKMLIESLI